MQPDAGKWVRIGVACHRECLPEAQEHTVNTVTGAGGCHSQIGIVHALGTSDTLEQTMNDDVDRTDPSGHDDAPGAASTGDAEQPDAEQPQGQDASRPWYRKKRLVIPLALLVVFVAVGALGDPDDEQVAEEPEEALEAEDAADEDETTDEDEAVDEDEAAEQDEEADAAEEPDEEPVEEPDEADEPDAGLGVVDPVDFDAFTIEGQGDDVIDLSVPEDAPAVASIVHDGDSNFAVEVDVDSELIDQDLLVNTIGAYEGQHALNVDGAVSEAVVTADGAWAIDVAPLAEAAQDFDDLEASGTGDAVLWAPEGVGGAVAISHEGESNFAVTAAGDYMLSPELLVNEIGSYEGTVRLEEPTVLVSVTADGDWSISPD